MRPCVPIEKLDHSNIYLLCLKLNRGEIHDHGVRDGACGVTCVHVRAWNVGDRDREGHDRRDGDDHGCHAYGEICCRVCGDGHEDGFGSWVHDVCACGGDEVKEAQSDREGAREVQKDPGPNSAAADPAPEPARCQGEDYLPSTPGQVQRLGDSSAVEDRRGVEVEVEVRACLCREKGGGVDPLRVAVQGLRVDAKDHDDLSDGDAGVRAHQDRGEEGEIGVISGLGGREDRVEDALLRGLARRRECDDGEAQCAESWAVRLHDHLCWKMQSLSCKRICAPPLSLRGACTVATQRETLAAANEAVSKVDRTNVCCRAQACGLLNLRKSLLRIPEPEATQCLCAVA